MDLGYFPEAQVAPSQLKLFAVIVAAKHLHALLLDGAFAPDAAGELVFHSLPSLTNAELSDLLQVVRVRALGFLARRGVIDDQGKFGAVDDAFTEREPALAAVAACREKPSSATLSGALTSTPEKPEMMRTFSADVEKCDRCGARLKLRALVTLPASVERLLRHLGEPTEPLALSRARGPPYFKSRAVRRKLGELEAPRGQLQIFGA